MPKKRPELKPDEQAGLFKRTGPAEPEPAKQAEQEQPPDPVKAIGIGLRESEWQRLDEIAQELGTTRHSLALWALRDFISRYEAGDIQPVTKKTLPGL